jgi:uncharacterized membrane-anchored protein
MKKDGLDHPLRIALVNELHARPFPSLDVPSTAVFIAIKEPVDAHSRDRDRDRAHLLSLLDRYGSPHPHPQRDATHFNGKIGRSEVTWENHTEFVTYSAFSSGLSVRAFDPAETEVFPADWLARMPRCAIASLSIRVEALPADETEIFAKLDDWFVAESLAVARVVDGAAIIAGDFRLDPAGQMCFVVFIKPGTGPRRIGRIVQRLCEIETYRAMSMLGLMRARKLTARLNALDPALSALVSELDTKDRAPDAMLHDLLAITGELESLAVQHSFRFGATGAYEAIVNQRITAMREQRVYGRQTFTEFMARRYDPAIRTAKSTEGRLKSMLERAARAAELLSTRVDVERSAQNQALLESMDRRADLALRLQHTAEGLSVVAISYYAVGLAGYVAAPLSELAGMTKTTAMAVLTPLVVLAVWFAVRRIRTGIGSH